MSLRRVLGSAAACHFSRTHGPRRSPGYRPRPGVRVLALIRFDVAGPGAFGVTMSSRHKSP